MVVVAGAAVLSADTHLVDNNRACCTFFYSRQWCNFIEARKLRRKNPRSNIATGHSLSTEM